jgi:hypothetical protein
MAITKKEGRQEHICAIVEFAYDDFGALVGTSDTETLEAVNLPTGAIVTGGMLVIDTPFNTEGVKSTGTLTTTNAPSNDDTVTIGTTVYTYKTALSTGPAVPYEVLIGVSETTANANLAAAINGAAGAGTTYATGTVAHPDVVAGTATAHTVPLVARVGGVAGDLIATTEAHDNGSFAEVTLTGGVAGGDVLIVKIGGVALSGMVDAQTAAASVLTPVGTVGTAPDTVDILHGVAADSITTASAGAGRLFVTYVVDGRACFTQD